MKGRKFGGGRLRSEPVSCFVLDFMWRDCETLSALGRFCLGIVQLLSKIGLNSLGVITADVAVIISVFFLSCLGTSGGR